MVEAWQINPRFHGVAGFTSARRTAGTFLGHAVVELAFVRIHVTSGAGPVLEMIWDNLRGVFADVFRVALRTSNGQVCAGQNKSGLLMLGDGVGGRLEACDDVTFFAAIFVRC